MEIIKASLDRFEGQYAVAYSDEGDNRKFDILRNVLQDDIKPGMRLLLHMDDNGAISRVEIDLQATNDAKERIKRKYQRLQEGRHLHKLD